MSTVEEYLIEKSYWKNDGWGAGINVGHDTYRVEIDAEPIPLSMANQFKQVDFDDYTKVEVVVGARVREYLDEGVEAWAQYGLIEKVAAKYELEVESWEKSVVFKTYVVNKEQVDNLVEAVKEFDKIYNSEDFRQLQENLPKFIDAGLVELLGQVAEGE